MFHISVVQDHGKELAHFDHVVDLTDEPNGRVRPHGLLGQTATFTKPVCVRLPGQISRATWA